MLEGHAAVQLVGRAAEALKVSPRVLFERSNAEVGEATFLDYRDRSVIPTWFEAHCRAILEGNKHEASGEQKAA